MKEKVKLEDTNGGIKRGKIFEVLNKKRKSENTPTESGKNQKKKMFILYKVTPTPNPQSPIPNPQSPIYY